MIHFVSPPVVLVAWRAIILLSKIWWAGKESNLRCILRHGFTVRCLRHSAHLPVYSYHNTEQIFVSIHKMFFVKEKPLHMERLIILEQVPVEMAALYRASPRRDTGTSVKKKSFRPQTTGSVMPPQVHHFSRIYIIAQNRYSFQCL